MPVSIVTVFASLPITLNSAHWASHKLYYTNRVCCLLTNTLN